jgi:hypothetical protein
VQAASEFDAGGEEIVDRADDVRRIHVLYDVIVPINTQYAGMIGIQVHERGKVFWVMGQ